jgi:Lactoylglutathione lyase and related lyases
MRINHINIVVSNMERSLNFYEGLLGLRRVFETDLTGEWIESVTAQRKVNAHCVFLQPEGGGCRIELLEYRNPKGGLVPNNSLANTIGVRHLAFEVDDVQATFEQMVAKGTPFLSEPVEVPFSLMGNVRKRLCYAVDPDGVIVEIADYRNVEAETDGATASAAAETTTAA